MTNQQREDIREIIKITFDNYWNTDDIMTPPWTWANTEWGVDYNSNELEIDRMFESELHQWEFTELVDYTDSGVGYNGRAWKLEYKKPTDIKEFYNLLRFQAKQYENKFGELLIWLYKEAELYGERTDETTGEVLLKLINYESSMNFNQNLFKFYPSVFEHVKDADFSHVSNPSDNEDEPIEFDVFEDELYTTLPEAAFEKDGVYYEAVNYGEDEISLIPFKEESVVWLWQLNVYRTKEEALKDIEEWAEEA